MTMPSTTRKGSPSMSMRSAESPAVALIRVAGDELRSEGTSRTVCHLIPVGSPPHPAARPNRFYGRHDLLRRHSERQAQSARPPVAS